MTTGDFRRHRFSPATGQASPTLENAGPRGSKRDTAALTATPLRIAPPLRQGKLRQAAKNRCLPLTQFPGTSAFPAPKASTK